MTFSLSLLYLSIGLALLGVFLAMFTDQYESHTWGIFIISNALSFIHAVMDNAPSGAMVSGLCAVYCGYKWWHSGPGGKIKKAAKELGDKSRQKIQAMVDSLAPTPQGNTP